MSTLEFHARASSAALAKFAAEDDEASVTALLEGCSPTQLADLACACGELLNGAAMTLCHNVGHLLAFMAEEQPPPRPEELASVARSITHTTVAIEVMRQSFKTEAEGQLAPSLATLQRLAAKSFGRSADHQLTEHSEGDDEEEDEP